MPGAPGCARRLGGPGVPTLAAAALCMFPGGPLLQIQDSAADDFGSGMRPIAFRCSGDERRRERRHGRERRGGEGGGGGGEVEVPHQHRQDHRHQPAAWGAPPCSHVVMCHMCATFSDCVFNVRFACCTHMLRTLLGSMHVFVLTFENFGSV